MNRAECVAFLQELEQRFDTSALLLNGINVWPLLRVKIGEQVIGAEIDPGNAGDPVKRNRAKRLITLLKGGIARASWWLTLPRADLLFHTKANGRIAMNGRIHDRFTDALLTAAESERLRSVVVEREHADKGSLALKARRIDVSAAVEAAAFFHWRRPKPEPRLVPGLPALLAYANERVHLDAEQLMNQLHGFLFYLRVHRRLLRSVDPKCVFVVCWYSVENMAIAHACRERGTRCVDLQHGVQGAAHIAYGNWTAIGTKGYTIMPDRFWCWDDRSAAHINRWAAGTPHHAQALGDPWNEMVSAMDLPSPWKNDGRKRILFTAQSLHELLPPVLLEAVRVTAQEAQWIIRTHPGWPGMAKAITEGLRTAGLLHAVTVDDARTSPLAVVLNGCSLHVTPFSSVILEATAAGVPSAAVHPHAADLYPDHIATGELRMTLQPAALIAMVRATAPTAARHTTLPPLNQRLRTAMAASPAPTAGASRKMSRPEIIAYLNTLEQQHNVNAMVLGDACVWPLLRQKIGEHMLRNEEPAGRADVELSGSVVLQLFRVASGLLQGLWSRLTLPRTDLLFQSLEGHKLVLDQAAYDRFADPLLSVSSTIGLRSIVFEHTRQERKRIKRHGPVHHRDLSLQLSAASILFWRKPLPSVYDVPGLQKLMSQLLADGHEMVEGFLMDQLHTFLFYRYQHAPLLRKTRPRCVFVVCWYSAENMAVMHECHALGIRTVDLQHGVQGPAHLAYGAWKAIPSNGYSLMPSVFWCWDEDSTSNIDRWAATTPHRALHLGDPFLEKIASMAPDARWNSDGRKRVLYAIQPQIGVIPASVISTIKATRGEAQWIIRTHPNFKYTTSDIVAILEREGLANEVIIDDGSATPIVALLGSCHLHVSDFSSVLLEAAALGIPSTAVHPYAADVFPELLAKGAFNLSLNAEDLLETVRKPFVAIRKPPPLPPLQDRLLKAIGDT